VTNITEITTVKAEVVDHGGAAGTEVTVTGDSAAAFSDAGIVKTETTAPPFYQSNTRSWKDFAGLINMTWRKGVTAFIDTGRYLLEAKAELERDVFESLVKRHLDFDSSVGRKLMAIAGNSIICVLDAAGAKVVRDAMSEAFAKALRAELPANPFAKLCEMDSGDIASRIHETVGAIKSRVIDEKLQALLPPKKFMQMVPAGADASGNRSYARKRDHRSRH
jgi:hypothetical protein